MNNELIGFFVGIATILFSVMVIWLLNVLSERSDKRCTEKDQARKSHSSKASAAIKAKCGNAKKPCDEDGSRPSCSQINDDIFEKHIDPNANGNRLADNEPNEGAKP